MEFFEEPEDALGAGFVEPRWQGEGELGVAGFGGGREKGIGGRKEGETERVEVKRWVIVSVRRGLNCMCVFQRREIDRGWWWGRGLPARDYVHDFN